MYDAQLYEVGCSTFWSNSAWLTIVLKALWSQNSSTEHTVSQFSLSPPSFHVTVLASPQGQMRRAFAGRPPPFPSSLMQLPPAPLPS